MMKKRIYSVFAMLSLTLMLAVVSAEAQTGNRIQVTVPFDFQIGAQTLRAGEYSVKQLSQNSMLVVSADGETRAIIMTPRTAATGANQKAAKEKLVFNKYGEQYFLSQVWLVRGANGRELNQTDAERRAAKELKLANNGEKPRKIEVAVGGGR